MKRVFLGFWMFFFLPLVMLAQHGDRVALSSHVSVVFPVTPVKTVNGFATTYAGRSPDSTHNVVAIVTDMQEALSLDAEGLSKEMEKEETWKQAELALMQSFGKSAILKSSSFTEVRGLKTMKLEVERPSPGPKPNQLSVFVFTYDTLSYNLIFVNRSGKADASVLERFLQDVQLTK